MEFIIQSQTTYLAKYCKILVNREEKISSRDCNRERDALRCGTHR